jgi:hypothetical protein
MMYLDMSKKEEILDEIKGKVISVAYLSACYNSLDLVFTDGSTLTIGAYIPKYEDHAELDIGLSATP